jgi:hypothetical protein
MFRVYWTDWEVPQADYFAAKTAGLLLAKQYHDIDDALGCCRQIIDARYGGVPQEIEGDDGTRLGRAEIIDTVRRRRTELIGRPKVY